MCLAQTHTLTQTESYGPPSPFYTDFLPQSSLLDLLPENTLERDSVGGELADALAQLVDGHGVLVEGEAEERLVVDVRHLLDVLIRGLAGVELLGDGFFAVVEVFQKVGLWKDKKKRMVSIKSWKGRKNRICGGWTDGCTCVSRLQESKDSPRW